MLRSLLVLSTALIAAGSCALGQASVRVELANLEGPRILADQTANAAVKNYIESWRSLKDALQQNRPELLNHDFVGTAQQKLTDTIQQQSKLGLKTSYLDHSHDIQIVFYSPEGLSVELIDNVEYDVQVSDKDKVLTTQPVHARYEVVMTPTEVRWRVRVMQATAE
jgi:hypothetical protein